MPHNAIIWPSDAVFKPLERRGYPKRACQRDKPVVSRCRTNYVVEEAEQSVPPGLVDRPYDGLVRCNPEAVLSVRGEGNSPDCRHADIRFETARRPVAPEEACSARHFEPQSDVPPFLQIQNVVPAAQQKASGQKQDETSIGEQHVA